MTNPSSPTLDYLEVPCLDAEVFGDLLSLAARRPDFLGQMVARFIDHGQRSLIRLSDAAKRRDFQEASFVAHTLKGAARQIGGSCLAHECEGLVQACERNTLEELELFIDRVRRAHARTVTELLAHDTLLH